MIKNIKKMKLDARGFTLIELIVSLVLIGIIAAIAGMGIVQITKQYVFAQKAGETAQVAQVAMARMVKEITLMRSGSGSETALTIISPSSAGLRTENIALNTIDKAITVNGQKLIENISSLQFLYYDTYSNTSSTTYLPSTTTMIGISFTVVGADGISSTFTGRAFIRN